MTSSRSLASLFSLGTFFLSSLVACGSRTELEVNADALIACTSDGAACTADADCCSLQCNVGICARSPCRAGDAPVKVALIDLATSAPFADSSALGVARPLIAQTDSDLYLATDPPYGGNAQGGALSLPATIVRVPKRGGNVVTVASVEAGVLITSLVIDGAELFFSTSTDVRHMPLQGGVPEVIATSSAARISGIAVDASFVYFVDDSSSAFTGGLIERVPRGGGAKTTVGGTFPASPSGGICSVGEDVFYGSDGLGGGLFVEHDSGGAASSLVSVFGSNLPGIVKASDASSIYFETGEGDSTLLLRVPLSGGAFTLVSSPGWWASPAAPMAGGPAAFASVATDDSHIYFTSAELGALFVIPIDGEHGNAAQSFNGVTGAEALATDRTCVYWTSATPGVGATEIWRAPLSE